jgi:protein-disulfide isomerase
MASAGSSRLAAIASTTSTVVLVVCALVVTFLSVKRQGRGAPTASPLIVREPNWVSYGKVGRRLGATDAKVVLVEFSDFQCPACKEFAASLQKTTAKYPNDFAVVYRHLPLTGIHRHAWGAALASECAGEQGHFTAMHDNLFALSDSIGVLAWNEFAKRSGVPDVRQFARCMDDPRTAEAVARDTVAAREFGPPRTPTSVINGVRFVGGATPAVLDSLVRDALSRPAQR